VERLTGIEPALSAWESERNALAFSEAGIERYGPRVFISDQPHWIAVHRNDAGPPWRQITKAMDWLAARRPRPR